MISSALALVESSSAQPALLTAGVLQGLGYALLAVGLILIYRSTGVINVAYGATGGVAAAILVTLVRDHHVAYGLALAAAIAVGALVGAALELAVVRRLAAAPKVTLLVGTIGAFELLAYLTSAVPLHSTDSIFPTPLRTIVSFGSVALTGKDLLVIGLVPAAVAAVTLFLARTPTGLAIRASADNPDAAGLAGISVGRTSLLVWALAGALAAVSTSLVDAEINLIPQHDPVSVGPAVLLSALAAALFGRLRSLPLALAGGVLVGVVRVESQALFSGTPGVAELATFVIVLGSVLAFPQEDSRRDGSSIGLLALRLARTDEPRRARQGLVSALAVALVALVPFVVTDAGSLFLADRTLLFALVGLSALILTGWAGQISLGQIALFGIGASFTSLLQAHGLPFGLAVVEGSFAGVVVAVVVGLPALRVKGLFLAVSTLSFAVAAQQWLFNLAALGGRGVPLLTHRPSGLTGDRAWFWACEAVLVAAVVFVRRLRASGVGRGLIAVRANEDRAAALGRSPALAKLTAFAISGGLAACAGGFYAAAKGSSGPSDFGVYDSLTVIAILVVGGIGSVIGPVLGAGFVLGLPAVFHTSETVTILTSGVGLLVVLLYLPGGLIQVWAMIRPARSRSESLTLPVMGTLSLQRLVGPPPAPDSVVIRATDIHRSFAGQLALDGVDLHVEHGEILGLIGANGSGKSTLLDVICGLTRPSHGSVELLGQDVTSMASHVRARLGLGRSFQDARLFGDLTVLETFAVAAATRNQPMVVPVVLGLPVSRKRERTVAEIAARTVDALGLQAFAHRPVQALSTGTRRVVEIGCLLAQESKVLLLDEPAAGLAQREVEALGPLLLDVRNALDATVVLVEHDLALVTAVSDRLQCLSRGRTIAVGTALAVRNDPAVIAAYVGSDLRTVERSGAERPKVSL